jgi:hypothetical protein
MHVTYLVVENTKESTHFKKMEFTLIRVIVNY